MGTECFYFNVVRARVELHTPTCPDDEWIVKLYRLRDDVTVQVRADDKTPKVTDILLMNTCLTSPSGNNVTSIRRPSILRARMKHQSTIPLRRILLAATGQPTATLPGCISHPEPGKAIIACLPTW
jgi:hypothetical protein